MSSIDYYRKSRELLDGFKRDIAEKRPYLRAKIDSGYTMYSPEDWLTQAVTEAVREHEADVFARSIAILEAKVEAMRLAAVEEAQGFIAGEVAP